MARVNVKIEDFKRGWVGMQIGMTQAEVDVLMDALKRIRETQGHFHCHSTFQDANGVADIQFSVVPDDFESNMKIG